MKNINQYMKEVQQTPNTRTMKKTILRHIQIKLLKTSDKEKILKASMEKRHKPTLYKNFNTML